MADVFYTILVVWVLWKIFGGSAKTYVFHQHNNAPPKKDGNVSVSYKKTEDKGKADGGGEYIDYEEVK
jgi:hypothetical protein